MSEALLEVKNLVTNFYTEEGVVRAVNDVSFSIGEQETVCIVGESGCGKSITSLSIMQLINENGKIENGEVNFAGRNLLKLNKKEISRLRGNDIGMIFQEPMTSLNPVYTIGQQMIEPLQEHLLLSRKEAYKKAQELITRLGIPNAEKIINMYPHELSGGMLQRIMIGIAISCNPKLIIADEPTTALDVTIQAQILDILRDIKEQFKTSILLITHDLGVVAEMADYVVVMYAGKIVEQGPVLEMFTNPQHPYTKGLLKAKPVIGERKEELYTIAGQVPNLAELYDSCYFADRCEHCMDICRTKHPELEKTSEYHSVSCYLYEREAVR
ncbi:ABC transporter ATP-binding protein [Fictibacillus sp. KIGAM418]|uniref:ABC transporter ATP-binding protein n=1 Tax=Fictibacillus marinisediminis TaxID=2878389 RepID=A0A9X2BD11_9BACL|nr:ABC transporter ATP-binding protein [Fictibacillus marinisediminis]MCK6256195.1 ABC transporter ATP-binding protein [Fictibacillus marinisediminis]